MLSRTNRMGMRGAVVSLAVGLAACSDQGAHAPLVPDDVEVGAAESLAGTAQAEQSAFEVLVSAVAQAVQEPSVRERIRANLHASRHTAEHKLDFSAYVRSMDGAPLLAAMAQRTGLEPDMLQGMIDAVRPLEFYMPVTEHRELWTGGEVLVVGQLEEEDPLVAFDTNAAPINLTTWGDPPATPSLSLVPIETDFSNELDRAKYENVGDSGGRSIGTYRPRGSGGAVMTEHCVETLNVSASCDGGGGGGGSTTLPPDGLYMTYSYLTDLHEPWTRGNPEIEAHIHGPKNADKSYGLDLSCAGNDASGYRYFDQNDHSWSGSVLLFTRAEIEDFNGQFALASDNEGFNVWVWEDDDTACVIKTDRDMTTSLGKTAAAVATGVALIVTGGTSNWWKAAASFLAAAYESATWLKSNDDYVGVGILRSTNDSATIGYYDVYTEQYDRGDLTLELKDY